MQFSEPITFKIDLKARQLTSFKMDELLNVRVKEAELDLDADKSIVSLELIKAMQTSLEV